MPHPHGLDPEHLTPGVLDGYALRMFKYGACGGLAIAIHDATGWPIVAITDPDNVEDGRAGGGSAMHWTVQAPNGQLLDVDGLHDPEVLLAEYMEESEEGAAIGRSTRADAAEWYVEAQGEPIPLRLIAAFVEPVLVQAGLRDAQPEDRSRDSSAPPATPSGRRTR